MALGGAAWRNETRAWRRAMLKTPRPNTGYGTGSHLKKLTHPNPGGFQKQKRLPRRQADRQHDVILLAVVFKCLTCSTFDDITERGRHVPTTELHRYDTRASRFSRPWQCIYCYEIPRGLQLQNTSCYLMHDTLQSACKNYSMTFTCEHLPSLHPSRA